MQAVVAAPLTAALPPTGLARLPIGQLALLVLLAGLPTVSILAGAAVDEAARLAW